MGGRSWEGGVAKGYGDGWKGLGLGGEGGDGGDGGKGPKG